jgi:hypothetical protein
MPARPFPPGKSDETSRPTYILKTRVFETLNVPLRPPAPQTPSAAADPGDVAHINEPISAQALSHIATGDAPVLGPHQPINRINEIHALLKVNLRHDQQAGYFDLKPGVDTKK